MKQWTILTGLCLAAAVNAADASELSHRFENPTFGGNPFNAAPLLSQANAQNEFEEAAEEESVLEDFEDRLNRSILNRLSNEIVDGIFGDEDGVPTGDFDVGNFQLSVQDNGGEVSISVIDQATGDATTVLVPTF